VTAATTISDEDMARVRSAILKFENPTSGNITAHLFHAYGIKMNSKKVQEAVNDERLLGGCSSDAERARLTENLARAREHPSIRKSRRKHKNAGRPVEKRTHGDRKVQAKA
jgi:hypothetical protein